MEKDKQEIIEQLSSVNIPPSAISTRRREVIYILNQPKV